MESILSIPREIYQMFLGKRRQQRVNLFMHAFWITFWGLYLVPWATDGPVESRNSTTSNRLAPYIAQYAYGEESEGFKKGTKRVQKGYKKFA